MTVDIVGTQLRMRTTITRAEVVAGELDPTANANEGLAALHAGELIREETVYLRVLPGYQVADAENPARGEVRASGASMAGVATLWAGLVMGPRMRLVSDVLVRDPDALPVEERTRMYGLVAGELMWTQEQRLGATDSRGEGESLAGDEDGEVTIDLSGRLARVGGAA